MKVKLLELRFYPIENQHCFKVSVEASAGEAHDQLNLPFIDNETPGNQDRHFTIVKVLESTQFHESNFSEDEQDWMVREKLLQLERAAFTTESLANIGRKLYQVLGLKIQQSIQTALAEAKSDRTLLHIRLIFPPEVSPDFQLTDCSWELLYDNYGFLAHQGVTFSRYIAYGSPAPNFTFGTATQSTFDCVKGR